MTHRKEIEEMLFWGHDEKWFGFDPEIGYFLKEAAPPEARESFKKWAKHQDEKGDGGINYSLKIA